MRDPTHLRRAGGIPDSTGQGTLAASLLPDLAGRGPSPPAKPSPTLLAPASPRPPPGGDGGRLRRLLPGRGSGPRRPDQRPGGRRLLQGLRPPAARPSAGQTQISPP